MEAASEAMLGTLDYVLLVSTPHSDTRILTLKHLIYLTDCSTQPSINLTLSSNLNYSLELVLNSHVPVIKKSKIPTKNVNFFHIDMILSHGILSPVTPSLP